MNAIQAAGEELSAHFRRSGARVVLVMREGRWCWLEEKAIDVDGRRARVTFDVKGPVSAAMMDVLRRFPPEMAVLCQLEEGDICLYLLPRSCVGPAQGVYIGGGPGGEEALVGALRWYPLALIRASGSSRGVA